MILLAYVLYLGPSAWPITPALTYAVLAELTAEDVLMLAIGARGLMAARKRARQ